MDKERLAYIDGWRDALKLLMRYLQAGLPVDQAIEQCQLYLESEHGEFVAQYVSTTLGAPSMEVANAN